MNSLASDLWELGKSNMTQKAPFVIHGSPTSEQAAISMEPHLGRLESAVLLTFRDYPEGRTDEEVFYCFNQEVNPVKESTIRARRVRLVQLGLLEDSGFTRLSVKKRNMTVWKLRAPEETQTRMAP